MFALALPCVCCRAANLDVQRAHSEKSIKPNQTNISFEKKKKRKKRKKQEAAIMTDGCSDVIFFFRAPQILSAL